MICSCCKQTCDCILSSLLCSGLLRKPAAPGVALKEKEEINLMSLKSPLVLVFARF